MMDEDPPPEQRPEPGARAAFPKVSVAAIVLGALYVVVVAALASDGRGGLGRLFIKAPLASGTWLGAGMCAGLALAVLLGWLTLARRAPSSLSLLPAVLLAGAGGSLSAMAATHAAGRVASADIASRHRLVSELEGLVELPRVLGLSAASVLALLAVLVGVSRTARAPLPESRRWGKPAAVVLAFLLGLSIPLTISGLSLPVSGLSLTPLLAVHYLALVGVAAALPSALRLRGASAQDCEGAAGGLGLACGAAPLAVLMAWQASLAAAAAAPTREAGARLAEALTLLGPQALIVTIAAAAITLSAAGATLRKVLAPRSVPLLVAVLTLAAAATHVWAAIARSGIRAPVL